MAFSATCLQGADGGVPQTRRIFIGSFVKVRLTLGGESSDTYVQRGLNLKEVKAVPHYSGLEVALIADDGTEVNVTEDEINTHGTLSAVYDAKDKTKKLKAVVDSEDTFNSVLDGTMFWLWQGGEEKKGFEITQKNPVGDATKANFVMEVPTQAAMQTMTANLRSTLPSRAQMAAMLASLPPLPPPAPPVVVPEKRRTAPKDMLAYKDWKQRFLAEHPITLSVCAVGVGVYLLYTVHRLASNEAPSEDVQSKEVGPQPRPKKPVQVSRNRRPQPPAARRKRRV